MSINKPKHVDDVSFLNFRSKAKKITLGSHTTITSKFRGLIEWKTYNPCNLLSKISLLLMMLCVATPMLAQGIQTEFGKNRVQYHDFEWNFYETDNYIVYFYQGGQDLAKFSLQIAEDERLKIEDKLEHQLSTKVEILVYHNLSDLLQTNIGLGLDQTNRGGQTQIVGSKVFVYYNGDHQDLKKQIIEGVSRVHFEQLTFGSSLQEILQNAVLLNLPPWFTDGLIAYVTEDWSLELDNRLRELISAGKQPQFNRLKPEDARFTGHALWHYIAQNYGENSIPNVLYLTRINRSIDSGFTFVFGNNVEEIVNEWWLTIQNEYTDNAVQRDLLDTETALFATKKKQEEKKVSTLKLSPNGKWLAYAVNDKGKIKVFLKNQETGTQEVLLKRGFKTYELPLGYNYPLLAWDEKSRKLAIVYQHRDVIYLRQYMPETGEFEEAPMTKFQQVLSLDYTEDNRRLVLAAVQNGQADLFTYFISNTKTRKLTDDFYDEIDISYGEMAGRKGVVFLSNRPNDTLRNEPFDTILPVGNMDVFFYDLNPTTTQPLIQLTNTPNDYEKSPRFYGDGLLSVLSAENGIYNQYVIQPDSQLIQTDRIVFFKDSTVTNPNYPLDSLHALGLIDSIINKKRYKYFGRSFHQSNYQYHIDDYDVSPLKKESIVLQRTKGRYFFYKNTYADNPLNNKTPLVQTEYRKQLTALGKVDTKTIEETTPTPVQAGDINTNEQNYNLDSVRLDTLTYFFQSEFDWINEDDEELAIYQFGQAYKQGSKAKEKKPIKLSRVRTYAPKFAIDGLAAQFGNRIFPFNQYEPYSNSATVEDNLFAFNPRNRMLFSAGINDLFEDYRLLGGFRVSFDLSVIEYFVEYRNLSKQLDHHWLIYRKTERRNTEQFVQTPQINRFVTNYFQKSFVYPLDIVSRVGAHIALRQNKIVPLINSDQALDKASTQQQYLQTKLEYVFDNTVQVTQNVLNGSRAKVYAEFYKKFSATINDTDLDFQWQDQGWFGVIGGDFRHYQPIHRQIVWANRFSFGVSFGKEKVLYYLGGVDHWINFGGEDRRFNQDTPINQEGNYAFQSLAPHLRGFRYNVRNGSKHALWNSEVRIPVFTYLFNRPIRSQFIRNFMVVGFTDAGTAWEQGNPFADENRYAVDVISNNEDPQDNNPVEVRIRYFRNPIVLGYGYGFRSTFLGYYIKLDRAWGRDSGVTGDDRWYLSIGLDF